MSEKPVDPSQVPLTQGQPPDYYPAASAPPAQGIYPNAQYAAQQPMVPAGQPQATTVIVTGQPGVVGQVKPNNYLGFSIFTLLCCNLICGIIALVCSIQTDSAWGAGDVASARSKSKTSLILNVVALVCGILTYVIVLVVVFVILPGGIAVVLAG